MKGTDIFLFLLGNGDATRRIAGSWWSLLVAALWVITGGIARNYDHLDLLRNPEWIYGPFAASAITSLLVFAVVYPFLRLGKVTSGRTGYLSFLCLYWMTAPCAWLYAVPVESFTDLVTATGWNIGFLAVVSVWRVFLITRSLAVVTGAGMPTCLVAVLFPSSVIMCVGSFFKGLSLVGIMGGVRLPPHTELLVNATNGLVVLAFFVAVILLLAMVMMVATGSRHPAERPLPWRREQAPRAALLAAGAFVALGLLAVIPVQVSVQRNHHLASLLESGSYREAIDYASRFERSDFSTIHYLPPDPHKIYGGSRRHYQAIFSELNGEEPRWLREVWMEQYADAIVASNWGLDDEDLQVIRRVPGVRKRVEKLAAEPLREKLRNDLSVE